MKPVASPLGTRTQAFRPAIHRPGHCADRGSIMNHETALSTAKEIADRVLAPAARQNDKEGRFSTEAVDALGRTGLLGLLLPTEFGAAGLGPRTFAPVTATLAEADASPSVAVTVANVRGP